jgi:predicted ATPase
LLRELTPRNLLSFGPEVKPITLEQLNILIGPNGSGKSNFIEAVVLLSSTPGDIHAVIRRGGGVREWIWKGVPKEAASLDVVIHNPHGTQPLRHALAFREGNQAFRLADERIENEHPYPGETEPYFFYRYQQGRPVLNITSEKRQLVREAFESDASILAQRRDPEAYPEVSYLTRAYEKIRA